MNRKEKKNYTHFIFHFICNDFDFILFYYYNNTNTDLIFVFRQCVAHEAKENCCCHLLPLKLPPIEKQVSVRLCNRNSDSEIQPKKKWGGTSRETRKQRKRETMFPCFHYFHWRYDNLLYWKWKLLAKKNQNKKKVSVVIVVHW